VNGPLLRTLRSSPPLSCNTTVPESPETVPPIEYVLGGEAVALAPTARMLARAGGVAPGAVPAALENAGLLFFVVLPLTGLLNVTAGGTASTVQNAWAGVGSCLPEGLIARTSKACGPSTSAV
jgi:hypothetical protein